MSETAPAAYGLDVGSTAVKLVGLDTDGNAVRQSLEPTEPALQKQLGRILESIQERRDGGPLPLVVTGYGRGLVPGPARRVTEITCHARGIFQVFEREGTLLDVGGQDSKAVSVGPGGNVLDFLMNDKCAAGTGRFLEYTASRLNLRVDEIGPAALQSSGETPISSTCTVFAESEIVSLIAQGTDLGAILKGLHRSLVQRLSGMIRAVGFRPPLMLSGGVARNDAVVNMLSDAFDCKALVPESPEFTGALGAALTALEGRP
ncbi:MAG: acyl-CoA dehydratase activase [Acidobacteriota bacterium]